ncbi:chain length determinant protein EpsF [Rugamonas sp. DEMB1]|jgi:succinoglycan biosynthesis transport protein ExoP|uniref:chain length determinant protein EpsF n=1 Tax=Rugamonas sp. DEMB1 TaxID=3039386 RepID=UPI0024488FB9|nr:chain length determinant protein EpsF [Rugamonas sp. DEMB1]WGG49146.1 chain length determinant protein EpsF [Rugamonas sp. DEMB1]
MNLSQFLLILRARSKIILAALVLTVGTTLVISLMMPKTYQATSSVLLNSKGVDPVSGLTMPGQLLPGYMATQIDIITSKNLALRVVDRLKLADSPAVQAQFNAATAGRGTVRDWLADLLLRKVEAVPARESSLVEISFKGADPQFVAEVANAFAEEYQRLNIQLKVDPMKKVSVYFTEQLKNSRDALEIAQSRLSKYQQEHGIVSVDNRLDVESNRLNDLSAQLVGAEGQLIEAASRQRMANGAAAESPDVAGNPVIQNLRLSLANAEAKLAEVGQRLDQNHPQYQSAKAEVDKMRAELALQTKAVTSAVGNNAQILRQRGDEVRAALLAQKNKVLELNRTRDEMGVMIKDVESAQHAYDAIAHRSSQTRIEGQAEQTDIAILNPATAPLEPAGPKVLLNTALAVFLGSMLGVALGMVMEMLDRRVRSEADLSETLAIPVFAVIDWNLPGKGRLGLKKLLSPSRPRLN